MCVSAFERGQQQRNNAHFVESRASLLQCARPECGDVLLRECTRMYSEVEAALPSVVFSARDEARGADRRDVSVSIDGKLVLDSLDGKAMPLDPGQYRLTFAAPGVEPITRDIVLRTGEKYRQISVVFPAPEVAVQPVPVAPPAPVVEKSRGVPLMSYVLGGIGVVGLAGFGTLRLMGSSDYDTLRKSGCAPTCDESEVSSIRTKYVLSNIALGVGAAAVAGAVVVYAIQPEESEAPNLAVMVGPGSGGTTLRVRTEF